MHLKQILPLISNRNLDGDQGIGLTIIHALEILHKRGQRSDLTIPRTLPKLGDPGNLFNIKELNPAARTFLTNCPLGIGKAGWTLEVFPSIPIPRRLNHGIFFNKRAFSSMQPKYLRRLSMELHVKAKPTA
jgi:hypothetical protein